MRRLHIVILTVLLTLLASCAGHQPNDRPFRLKNLAKSDIDLVADAHVEEITGLLRELTLKLYRRNPRELLKGPAGTSVAMREKQLFDSPRIFSHPELYNRYGIDAFPLVFDPDFDGDRVFALMISLTGMLHGAYGYKEEFFMLDDLDQQRLYDSARNVEIIVWRLSNRMNDQGKLFILTNGISEEGVHNLSFERLFGKLIAHQDMMARIISDKTNRSINKAVFSLATTALFPI
ncbi:lipoprotein [Nitrincola sp. A-D6]|uniref:hypothetical protein n=1 Tax=Nitrincola sp. A-D6 TaxID=1545442 RepID=UPI00051F9BB7|nr:hypothetical protein [Nitrincola sp. A-D6]KGK43069.1 lipoprotein [Nitrincola sp. A-D6]